MNSTIRLKSAVLYSTLPWVVHSVYRMTDFKKTVNTIFNTHMPFYSGTYQLHTNVLERLYSSVYTHLNDDSPSNGEVPVKPCVPYTPTIALNPYHLKPTLVQLRLRFHLYIRAQVSVGITPCGNSSLLHNCYSIIHTCTVFIHLLDFLHIWLYWSTQDKKNNSKHVLKNVWHTCTCKEPHVSKCIWVKYWTIR